MPHSDKFYLTDIKYLIASLTAHFSQAPNPAAKQGNGDDGLRDAGDDEKGPQDTDFLRPAYSRLNMAAQEGDRLRAESAVGQGSFGSKVRFLSEIEGARGKGTCTGTSV